MIKQFFNRHLIMIDENWDINIQSTQGNQMVSIKKQKTKQINLKSRDFKRCWSKIQRKFKMFNATSIHIHTQLEDIWNRCFISKSVKYVNNKMILQKNKCFTKDLCSW